MDAEVCNIVQKVVSKTIPKKKKCKKAKWLSEEALQQLRKEEKQQAKETERENQLNVAAAAAKSECRVPENSKQR